MQLVDGFGVFVGLTVGAAEAAFVGVLPGDVGVDVDVDSPPEIGIWATAVCCVGVGVEAAPVSFVSGVREGNPVGGNLARGVSLEGDALEAGDTLKAEKSATATACAAGVSGIGGALDLVIADAAPTPIKINAVNTPARFNSVPSILFGIRTGFS